MDRELATKIPKHIVLTSLENLEQLYLLNVTNPQKIIVSHKEIEKGTQKLIETNSSLESEDSNQEIHFLSNLMQK